MNSLSDVYGYAPDQPEMDRALSALSSNLENVMSPEILKKCFSLMDLTSLRVNDTVASIVSLTDKVRVCHETYPDYPLPASVCVYPNFASVVKEHRCDPSLHVTVVAGCFPASQSFLEVKLKECEMAVCSGAEEVDIVLALNAFLAGDYDAARREIREIRRCVDSAASAQGRRVILKVILETGSLVTPENVAAASFLAMEEGADFIKTSTGKTDVGATPAAAYVMCRCIKKYYEKTGRKVGFKAAGGISTAKDAVGYYAIVKSILGEEWIDRSLFRFGVSRLANSLLSAVEQKTVAMF